MNTTNTTTPKLTELVINTYQGKKAKNPQYSYRAFARDLGISQSLLVKVISGTRNVSPELALRLGLHLELPEKDIINLAVSTFSEDMRIQ